MRQLIARTKEEVMALSNEELRELIQCVPDEYYYNGTIKYPKPFICEREYREFHEASYEYGYLIGRLNTLKKYGEIPDDIDCFIEMAKEKEAQVKETVNDWENGPDTFESNHFFTWGAVYRFEDVRPVYANVIEKIISEEEGGDAVEREIDKIVEEMIGYSDGDIVESIAWLVKRDYI